MWSRGRIEISNSRQKGMFLQDYIRDSKAVVFPFKISEKFPSFAMT
jgi:hypothetical protein